jgi:hypothetical protein
MEHDREHSYWNQKPRPFCGRRSAGGHRHTRRDLVVHAIDDTRDDSASLKLNTDCERRASAFERYPTDAGRERSECAFFAHDRNGAGRNERAAGFDKTVWAAFRIRGSHGSDGSRCSPGTKSFRNGNAASAYSANRANPDDTGARSASPSRNVTMKRWMILAFVATLGVASVAHAEPSTEQKRAQAEALNEEGKSLAHGKQYAAARAKFLQAYSLNPVPGALFNAARMEHLLGEYADALALYRTYVALPPSERVSVEGRKDAEAFAAECETKVCHIEVKVQGSFTVDNKPRPAPVVANVGSHVVEMSGPAGLRMQSIQCVAGKTIVVEYEPTKAIVPPPADKPETGSWVVPGVLAAVGVVGLGVGFGLGAAASGKSDDLSKTITKGQCADATKCAAEADSIASIQGLNTGAIVGYVVGGAGLVGAVVATLVLKPWEERRPQKSAWLAPTFAPGSIGMVAAGSF